MRALPLLFILAACGKPAAVAPTPPAPEGDDDVTTPEAVDLGHSGALPGYEFQLTYRLAMKRCEGAYPHADCDACFSFDQMYVAAGCDERPAYLSDDKVAAFFDAGHVVYDEAAWAECEPQMHEIEEMECTRFWADRKPIDAARDVCARAMTGTLATGAACSHDVECQSWQGCSDDGVCY